MNQKNQVVTVTNVKEAITAFTRLGYAQDRFFVAARRHTNVPFNPAEEAAAYRGQRQYIPSKPIQEFTSWLLKTDEKKREAAIAKLFGEKPKNKPRVLFPEEMVAGIA